MKAWDGLQSIAETLQACSWSISPGQFLQLLQGLLDSYQIQAKRVFAERVQVLSIERLGGFTYDHLYVGGLVEGQFPPHSLSLIHIYRGVLAVVITLGAQGAYGLTLAGEFHIPGHQVNVVDTVAAGDTFTGALAALIGEGRSLREAVEYANAAAAIAVTRRGAQPSVPTRAEVLRFLDR